MPEKYDLSIIYGMNSEKACTEECYLQEKATGALFSAKQLAYNKMGSQTPVAVLFKILDTQIQPIIDYGCEVWYQGKSIAVKL